MHGLIGKMRAQPGQRAGLAAILLKGTAGMPGCLSYVIADDTVDSDVLWITEVWTDEASHKSALQLPEVQAVIAEGRPLIAGFEAQIVTRPLGGAGLPDGR